MLFLRFPGTDRPGSSGRDVKGKRNFLQQHSLTGINHDDFAKELNFKSGKNLTLTVDRNGEEKELVLSPEKSSNDNLYKA